MLPSGAVMASRISGIASRYSLIQDVYKRQVYDCVDYEGVPFIDATATLADDGSVTVFCVNRSTTEPFALDVDLHGFGALRIGEHILLHNDDAKAVNTESAPYTVVPTPGPGGCIDGEKATLHIPDVYKRQRLCIPLRQGDVPDLSGPEHAAQPAAARAGAAVGALYRGSGNQRRARCV